MKKHVLVKEIKEANRRRTVTIHPTQLAVAGIEVGDKVKVYVDGKKIVIEKE